MFTCIVVVYFIKSSLKKANFTAEEKWHFSQTCVHCIFIFSIKIVFYPSHNNISKVKDVPCTTASIVVVNFIKNFLLQFSNRSESATLTKSNKQEALFIPT